jgi:hypothetical protein
MCVCCIATFNFEAFQAVMFASFRLAGVVLVYRQPQGSQESMTSLKAFELPLLTRIVTPHGSRNRLTK